MNPIRQPLILRKPRTALLSKKGMPTGLTSHWDSLAAQQAALNNMGNAGGSWWYKYTPTPEGLVSPAGVEFVSMVTDPNSQLDGATLLSVCQSVGQNGWLIYLNEPEQVGISVADAITGWGTLINDPNIISYNIQIVSPTGTTTAGPKATSQWLYDFMTGITALTPNRTPNAIAVHRYNDAASSIINAYAKYRDVYQGYRIWVSEFGPGTDQGLAGNEAFMLQVFNDLYSAAFCDRFAWFELGVFLADTWRNEANTDGSLTALGTYWKNLSL